MKIFIYQSKLVAENVTIFSRVIFRKLLGSAVASALDSRSIGRRFSSRPVHCRAATLGKLFTPMCLCHQAV